MRYTNADLLSARPLGIDLGARKPDPEISCFYLLRLKFCEHGNFIKIKKLLKRHSLREVVEHQIA